MQLKQPEENPKKKKKEKKQQSELQADDPRKCSCKEAKNPKTKPDAHGSIFDYYYDDDDEVARR